MNMKSTKFSIVTISFNQARFLEQAITSRSHSVKRKRTESNVATDHENDKMRQAERANTGSPLPRITVVMPSFNQAAFIDEAIQSILAQNYSNLEFMILDGGSTDGSKEIIERYSKYLAYWHSKPDNGQTDALIQGFERATGDLMGWINSDDVLLPGALHSIAQAYISNPEGGLFGGNYVLIDQDSRIIRCKRHPAQAAWFARKGLCIVNPGSFFKREDYKAVGGLHYDLHYVMDYDLCIRMMANGTGFTHTEKYLMAFRRHVASKTYAHASHARDELKYAALKYWPNNVRFPGAASKAIYRVYQLLNGNYARMTLETWFARGRHWRERFMV